MQNHSYEKEFHLRENVAVGENIMNGFAWKLILTQRQKAIQN